MLSYILLCSGKFGGVSVAALTLLVGFKHFNDGVQTLIEDYVHGLSQKVAIIAMTCISYGAAAVGVFAIAKLAL